MNPEPTIEGTAPRDTDLREAEAEMQELRDVLLHPNAIADPVRKGLFVAIQENKEEVADVIFPVIFPAIQMAIKDLTRKMIERVNRLLEDNLRPRSLRQQLRTATTGQTVAEVALQQTLAYEVEEVFLIHRDSGLLIGHVAATESIAEAPEVVSGMLTGIRDFVQDSFGTDSDDGVRRLEVGGKTVWVEQKGSAILAAVVTGTGPVELNWHLQNTLKEIDATHGSAIARFDGDNTALTALEPQLRTLLRADGPEPSRRVPWAGWLAVAVALVVVATTAVAVVRHIGWRSRAIEAVNVLDDEPGYRLLQHRRTWSQVEIMGLRDPLARPVDQVLATIPIAPEARSFVWIEAPDPRLALNRARATLQPPPSVDVRLSDGGTLVVTGTASVQWPVGARADRPNDCRRAAGRCFGPALPPPSSVPAGRDDRRGAERPIRSRASDARPDKPAAASARHRQPGGESQRCRSAASVDVRRADRPDGPTGPQSYVEPVPGRRGHRRAPRPGVEHH